MRKYRLSEQNTSFDQLFGRRILFFLAVFSLLGSLCAAKWEIGLPICLFAGALFLFMYVVHRRKAFAVSALLFAAFFFSCGFTMSYFTSLGADFARIQRSAISGTVVDYGKTESGAYKYKLRDVTAGEEKLKHCVYVYADYGEYHLGDVIRAYGAIEQPTPARYAYDFDARLYHASEGVCAVMYAEYTEKRGESAGLVQRVRTALAERIDCLFGEQAGTAKAMLIGLDADIDYALAEAYRDAGISHILCISGLHVSVLVSAVCMALRRLRVGKTTMTLLCIAFLLCYMLIAGASSSILRAGILNIGLLSAYLFHRRGDLLTSLAAGYFVCVCLNPACMFGLGFQLSFGCVFTLTCMADVFGKNKLLSAFGTALCGCAASAVILWNVNFSVAPLTILFNLVAVPFASMVLVVLFVSLLVFLLLGGAFPQLGFLGRWMLKLMDWGAEQAAAVDCRIAVKAVHPIAILCIFLAIFFASKYLIAPRAVRIGSALCMVAVFAVLYLMPVQEPILRIDFLPHEYADTAVLRDDAGNCILLDAGNPYGAEYLAASGISAQTVLLSAVANRDELSAYPNAECFAPEELSDGMKFHLNARITVTAFKEDDAHVSYLVQCDGENILLYLGCSPTRTDYPAARIVKLSSDGKKNIAFAGNSGAEYVILRTSTERIAALSIMNAGGLTVRYDGNLTVESKYDGRTILESTDA